MLEPVQLDSLIKQRVQEAVSTAQNDIVHHMDRIIKSSFDAFQKSTNEDQRQLSETQLAKIEEMKSNNYVFKRKGNEEQFKVNSSVANRMKEARYFLREDPEQTEQTQMAAQSISEDKNYLNWQNQSESGWKTVTEYETHSLADDSEDEKRIIRAENKAASIINNEKQCKQHRSTPYSTSQLSRFNSNAPRNNVPVQRPGKCYECGIPGHWMVDHQTGAFGASMQRNKIDKISQNVNSFDKTVEKFDSFDKSTIAKDTHLQFVKLDNRFKSIVTKVNSNDSPVNRLRNAYTYWQSINANDYILSIIRDGYRIPFYTEPKSCSLKNNKTAFDNAEFVESEITKLIGRGCLSQVPELPKVVNPLTVARNTEKFRLVLDCRHINPCLHKFRFKYEEAVEASHMFEKGDYLFTYDLRSAIIILKYLKITKRT
ncbi:Hypothetical predicted protein [Mytilus galloprovincialis]|uniref:CCHC-type domain-containing protein n=1 Tax=Mytilus galloprovincialis TaxID=29158 RepID=A0A8B6DMH8_MYTGA|nr:Hypothetical predicted protein [Mytilus galloprovincialis]